MGWAVTIPSSRVVAIWAMRERGSGRNRVVNFSEFRIHQWLKLSWFLSAKVRPNSPRTRERMRIEAMKERDEEMHGSSLMDMRRARPHVVISGCAPGRSCKFLLFSSAIIISPNMLSTWKNAVAHSNQTNLWNYWWTCGDDLPCWPFATHVQIEG